MGKKVLISVIVVTYNRCIFLKRMIDSIINQKFRNYEIIIVNNGSNDETNLLLEKYIYKYRDFINVVNINNSTISHARNVGLDVANGDYIAYVDDDDFCDREYLNILYSLVNKYKCDIAICDSKIIRNGKLEIKMFPDAEKIMSAREAIIELLNRKFIKTGLPMKLVKKELLDLFRFYDDKVYDDIFVCYKLIALANGVAYTSKPLYNIVRHGCNNSSFTDNFSLLTPLLLDEYIEAFQERLIFLKEIFPDLSAFFLYTNLSWMISMGYKIKLYKLENCSKHFEFFKNEIKSNILFLESNENVKNFEKEWIRSILDE